jgi:hypothetical protein
MELTTRRPKYHQQFWPDHKEEGMDHVDTATLSGLGRTCKLFAFRGRCTLWLGARQDAANIMAYFFKRYIEQTVYSACKRINYKIIL